MLIVSGCAGHVGVSAGEVPSGRSVDAQAFLPYGHRHLHGWGGAHTQDSMTAADGPRNHPTREYKQKAPNAARRGLR